MRSGVQAPIEIGWRPLAGLDRESRVLAIAIGASIALHALALAVHFRFPEALRKAPPTQLDVVLVNSKTLERPRHPMVYAQANLDGGGNTDLKRRAKTPLPQLAEAELGRDLAHAAQRVRALEAKQKRLLAQASQPERPVVDRPAPRETVQPQPSGAELAERTLAIARLQAQIAHDIDEYNQRPRKLFIGARAAEVSQALYVESWRQKIERVGNLNYPEAARGKIYGSLRLSVSINADGSLAGVNLERSSGYRILDEAAERIVHLAAPFARFPPDIRSKYDILVITRTWHFAPGDKVFSD